MQVDIFPTWRAKSLAVAGLHLVPEYPSLPETRMPSLLARVARRCRPVMATTDQHRRSVLLARRTISPRWVEAVAEMLWVRPRTQMQEGLEAVVAISARHTTAWVGRVPQTKDMPEARLLLLRVGQVAEVRVGLVLPGITPPLPPLAAWV